MKGIADLAREYAEYRRIIKYPRFLPKSLSAKRDLDTHPQATGEYAPLLCSECEKLSRHPHVIEVVEWSRIVNKCPLTCPFESDSARLAIVGETEEAYIKDLLWHAFIEGNPGVRFLLSNDHLLRAWTREADPVRQARKREGKSLFQDFTATNKVPRGSGGETGKGAAYVQEADLFSNGEPIEIVLVGAVKYDTEPEPWARLREWCSDNKGSVLKVFDHNRLTDGVTVANIESIVLQRTVLRRLIIIDFSGKKSDRALYNTFLLMNLTSKDMALLVTTSSGGFVSTTRDSAKEYTDAGFSIERSPFWHKFGFGTCLIRITASQISS